MTVFVGRICRILRKIVLDYLVKKGYHTKYSENGKNNHTLYKSIFVGGIYDVEITCRYN